LISSFNTDQSPTGVLKYEIAKLEENLEHLEKRVAEYEKNISDYHLAKEHSTERLDAFREALEKIINFDKFNDYYTKDVVNG
jgi:chromosome segregation ATPase